MLLTRIFSPRMSPLFFFLALVLILKTAQPVMEENRLVPRPFLPRLPLQPPAG